MPVFIIAFVIIVICLLYIVTMSGRGQSRDIDSGYSKLDVVNEADYSKKNLLSETKRDAYFILMDLLNNDATISSQQYRLFIKVNLGEIIDSKLDQAFYLIKAKHIDFCITDRNFNPLAIVEYHDREHFKEPNYKESDAMKKLAVEKAGIVYYVIHYTEEGSLRADLEQRLLPLLPK